MNHRLWKAGVLCMLPPLLYGVAVTALRAEDNAHAKRNPKKEKGKIARPTTSDSGAAATGRWALLVGVGNYVDNQHFTPLRSDVVPDTPAKDVADLAATLRRVGYAVTCLTCEEPEDALKPLRGNILHELRALADPEDGRIQEEDTVLVYFSCHGYVGRDDRAYLAANDTRYEDPGSGVAISEVLDALVGIQAKAAGDGKPAVEAKPGCPAKNRILILDACHSGQTGDRLTQEASVSGLVMMSSSKGSEQSYLLEKVAGEPERANSVYTYYLMKGLQGLADENRDGQITHPELHKFVHNSVTDWSMRIGTAQTPVLSNLAVGQDVVVSGRLKSGTLALNAVPWAEVFVDGQARGTTPKLLKDIPVGRHVVLFRNPARPTPIERKVEITAGGEESISVEFPKK